MAIFFGQSGSTKNGFNTAWNWFTDKWNDLTGQNKAQEIANSTNAINKQISDENLALQQDWNEYQKALQERVFEREDTAYQRTANDMMAAGLNPLSMQGTNNAGAIVSTAAPQQNYQAQQAATAISTLDGMMSGIGSILSQIESIKTGKLQRDELQTKIDYQRLINDGLSRELNHKIDIDSYDTDMLPEKIITHLLDWTKNGRFGKNIDFTIKDLFSIFDSDYKTGIPFIDDIKKLIDNEINGTSYLAERLSKHEEEKTKNKLKKSYQELKNNKHVQEKSKEYKQRYGGK